MLQISPSIEYSQLPNQFFQEELPPGKQLIIVGESSNGDFYQPIVCSNEIMAATYFGSGPLIDRFQDAMIANSDGIYLMRMEPGRLDKVYFALSKFPFDLIYIDGFYFNTSYDQIPAFIDFAKEKEELGQLIHGFFDVEGIQTFDDVQNLYPLIKDLSFPIEDGIEDTGKFLSVVLNQVEGQQAGPAYAGLVASLSPETSPINKTIDVTLTQEWTNDQILELRNNGIVAFRTSIKKGVVCTSSSTAVATEGSPHQHISNFRIAQAFLIDVYTQLDPMIGTVGITFIQDKAEGILEQLFSDYVLIDRLKTGSYLVTVNPPEGIVTIDLELIPIFAVNKMNQSSQVRVRT